MCRFLSRCAVPIHKQHLTSRGAEQCPAPGPNAPHLGHNRLFALWGVGVVEASRGSWTVSWDDDRTQEFTLGASSTKTRMQFGYPNFLQRPKTLQFQRCDFNV